MRMLATQMTLLESRFFMAITPNEVIFVCLFIYLFVCLFVLIASGHIYPS